MSSQIPLSDVVTRLRAAGCVYAEDEARLLTATARTPEELDRMVSRRVSGLPVEQVVGWAEFCGLQVAVEPGVFVPRRRTEFLVSQAAQVLASADGSTAAAGTRPVLLDLCCGSGAVGAAIAAAWPQLELHAADIDPAAVQCAARNVARTHGEVYQGDLYLALPASLRGRIDVIVASPPYVPTGSVRMLPPEAREHEPLIALDGGADGLDVLRQIAAGAPQWLAAGGSLLVETSDRQAERAAEAVHHHGLAARVARSEELSAAVVIGSRG
jgi:release factor glutamine methyltransferase